MDQSGGHAQECIDDEALAEPVDPVFSAILTPQRSLAAGGFYLLMAAVAGVSLAAGVAFFLAGAWPVIGFIGIDALLIWWAFRLNYRAARLYETVDLTDDTLTVTRVLPSGQAKSWTFNPYWVRCQISGIRGRANELSLTSHGRRLIFGSFLTADEKHDFAAALSGALRDARGGSRI